MPAVPLPARHLVLAALAVLVTTAGCSTPSLPTPTEPSVSAYTDLSAVSVGPSGGEASAAASGGSGASANVAAPPGEAVTPAGVAAPTLTIKTPLSVASTTKEVLSAGTGPAAVVGKRVTIDYVGYNGTDGQPFDSSYGSKPRSFMLAPSGNLKGIVDALVGVPAGSRLLVAIPPSEAYGLEGRPNAGIGPTDTIVLLIHLRAVQDVLSRATGTAVAAKAGLPTVALGARGAPRITVPKTAPPAELVVQPLVTGKGAKVAKGQQITVHYTGVLWPGGTQFDSSWGRTPSTFEIGTGRVIAGWDRGLVGQTVGSQVLLVIPPDEGYGAAGKPDVGISGTDVLVFVVDILDAA